MKKIFYTLILGLAFTAFANAQSSDAQKADAEVKVVAKEAKADDAKKDKECKTKNFAVSDKKSCATKKKSCKRTCKH